MNQWSQIIVSLVALVLSVCALAVAVKALRRNRNTREDTSALAHEDPGPLQTPAAVAEKVAEIWSGFHDQIDYYEKTAHEKGLPLYSNRNNKHPHFG